MNTLYQIEFVGGPWDGSDVTVARFSGARQELVLPAHPTEDRWFLSREDSPAGAAVSRYKRTEIRCAKAGAGTVIHMQYTFMGLEALQSTDGRQVEWPRLAPSPTHGKGLRRFRSSLRDWMLAPVSYPLAVHAGSEATSAAR
jgi:hypothetical protein